MMPGSAEWLIILGGAVLLFGPSKLPRLGSAIGEGIRNFKKGINGLHDDLDLVNKDTKELSSSDMKKDEATQKATT